MKTISFSDIRRVSWLNKYSEFDLLQIDMDSQVYEVLAAIGFDIEFPILYYPAKHRNLAGEVVTGYIACGEVQLNESKISMAFKDLTDILVCASYRDTSLMTELAELAFKTLDWSEALNDNDSLDWQEERAVLPLDQLEPDFEFQEAKIKELADILISIRGTPYTNAGSLKTAQDYIDFAEAREFYAEKYDV